MQRDERLPLVQDRGKAVEAVILYENAELLAFLDIGPIRDGHAQIIPKAHFETFDLLPPDLAAKVLTLGQRIAQRMKTVFRVERVAFLFTGGDVAHAHAHVVPMHDKTDITSGRYLTAHSAPTWSSDHLRVERARLEKIKVRLAFARS